MEHEKTVLVRAAIAVGDPAAAGRAADLLVRLALRTDHEVYISDTGGDFSILMKRMPNYDLAILDYDFLERNRERLALLYRQNPDCVSVPLGTPDGRICNFLLLRPAGHIRSLDEDALLDDGSELLRLWQFCAAGLEENDRVLQISTRRGIYSVTVSSILYCQSDLKYVLIVTADGNRCKKLGRLDELAHGLPGHFVRVHQSFLVNTQQVRGVDKTTHELILAGQVRVPYSRAHQETVAQLFQNCRFGGQM